MGKASKFFLDRFAKAFKGEPLDPTRECAVIGDIHGRLDCLHDLIQKLDQTHPNIQLVFVGDYIDRGDFSSQVLAYLMELQQLRPDCLFLKGNHEQMLLDFLDTPEAAGNRWLKYGGLQTVASFSVGSVRQNSNPEQLRTARDALRRQMGPEMEAWIRDLYALYTNGNIAIVHAAADPAREINKQSEHDLIWGHPDFRKKPRKDGMWIVHGHTIVPQPIEENGVISIDTGAYATDRLTAAVLLKGRLEFIQNR